MQIIINEYDILFQLIPIISGFPVSDHSVNKPSAILTETDLQQCEFNTEYWK